jgi:hypothetical protein
MLTGRPEAPALGGPDVASLGHFFSTISTKFLPDVDFGLPSSQPPTPRDCIGRARDEWKAATNYFEMVSDPDLVDHAIYLLEAAERKYMYLLKRAKAEGLDSPTF